MPVRIEVAVEIPLFICVPLAWGCRDLTTIVLKICVCEFALCLLSESRLIRLPVLCDEKAVSGCFQEATIANSQYTLSDDPVHLHLKGKTAPVRCFQAVKHRNAAWKEKSTATTLLSPTGNKNHVFGVSL